MRFDVGRYLTPLSYGAILLVKEKVPDIKGVNHLANCALLLILFCLMVD